MPRYFFDVIDNGESIPDDMGLTMADHAEARSQAAIGLLEYLMQRMSATKDNSPPEGNGSHEIAMLVREDGGPLLRVAVRFVIEELQ
jgi:hypothetical protein